MLLEVIIFKRRKHIDFYSLQIFVPDGDVPITHVQQKCIELHFVINKCHKFIYFCVIHLRFNL